MPAEVPSGAYNIANISSWSDTPFSDSFQHRLCRNPSNCDFVKFINKFADESTDLERINHAVFQTDSGQYLRHLNSATFQALKLN